MNVHAQKGVGPRGRLLLAVAAAAVMSAGGCVSRTSVPCLPFGSIVGAPARLSEEQAKGAVDQFMKDMREREAVAVGVIEGYEKIADQVEGFDAVAFLKERRRDLKHALKDEAPLFYPVPTDATQRLARLDKALGNHSDYALDRARMKVAGDGSQRYLASLRASTGPWMNLLLAGARNLDRWRVEAGYGTGDEAAADPKVYYEKAAQNWLIPLSMAWGSRREYEIVDGVSQPGEKVYGTGGFFPLFGVEDGEKNSLWFQMCGSGGCGPGRGCWQVRLARVLVNERRVRAPFLFDWHRQRVEGVDHPEGGRQSARFTLVEGILYGSNDNDRRTVCWSGMGALWVSGWGKGTEAGSGLHALLLGVPWMSVWDGQEAIHGPLWGMFGWGKKKGRPAIRLFWLSIPIGEKPAEEAPPVQTSAPQGRE